MEISIIFDETYKAFRRNDLQDIGKKHEEFLRAILQISGEPFHHENWEPVEIITSDTTDYQCVCSKKISNLCFIEHKKTKQRVMVGNVCVRKKVPQWESELDYLQDKYENKLCKYCDQRLNLKTKFCREQRFCDAWCQKKCIQKDWRKCIDCKQPFCEMTQPTWKKKCLECYISKIPTSRACDCCGDALPDDSPYWKKLCISCYFDRR
jgi:hypothetical protein